MERDEETSKTTSFDYNNFLQWLFVNNINENNFSALMYPYVDDRDKQSRIQSYRLFFGPDGLISKLKDCPTLQPMLLVALRTYLEVSGEQEKNLSAVKKKKNRIFIRMLVTALMKELKIKGHSNNELFEGVKFNTCSIPLIKKNELADSIENIRVCLNQIIAKNAQEFILTHQLLITDAKDFLELMLKKEYETGHTEEKVKIERKIAVSLYCLSILKAFRF